MTESNTTNSDSNLALGSTDSAAKEDKLNLDRYVEGFANFIKDCETPMTLSIQGNWGSGKTSFFNLVEQRLAPDVEKGSVQVIKINSWQYSVVGYSSNLIMVLLSTLIKELESSKEKPNEGEQSPSNLNDSWNKFKSFFKFTVRLLGTAAYGHISNGASLPAQLNNGEADEADANEDDQIDSLSKLKEALDQELENKFGGKPGGRFVIFVDDLDRLDPVDAVSLMEGVKNLVDFKHCVFVFAIDEDVVFEGVKQKYGNELGEKRKQSFFDKLIQVPYRLPMHAYNIEIYIQSILDNDHKNDSEEITRIIKELTGGNNPREIKRYFNLARMYECIAGANASSERANDPYSMLILATILKMKLTPYDLITVRQWLSSKDDNNDTEGKPTDDDKEELSEVSKIQSIIEELPEEGDDKSAYFSALKKWLDRIEENTSDDLDAVATLDGFLRSCSNLTPSVIDGKTQYCSKDKQKVAMINARKQTLTIYSAGHNELWEKLTKDWGKDHENDERFRWGPNQQHATWILKGIDEQDRDTIEKIRSALESFLDEMLLL